MKNHHMLFLLVGLAVLAFLVAFLVTRLSPKYKTVNYQDDSTATEVVPSGEVSE